LLIEKSFYEAQTCLLNKHNTIRNDSTILFKFLTLSTKLGCKITSKLSELDKMEIGKDR